MPYRYGYERYAMGRGDGKGGYPPGGLIPDQTYVAVKVRYFPRSGLATRMDGCIVYGSNTSPTADLVELYTISGSSAGWNAQTFANSTQYVYLIVKSTESSEPECAELEFYNAEDVKLTAVTPVYSANYNPSFPATNAFDGNTSTECATDGTTPAYLGIEVDLTA